MRAITLTPESAAALVDRLATYESMRNLPRAEREWLVANSALRSYGTDEKVVEASTVAEDMVLILSGRIVVYFGLGGGRRHTMESLPGTLTGVLPYSRLTSPMWDVLATEPTELLAVHRDRFPRLIVECPVLTESLVHNMLDRARRFAAAGWQDEKVLSLGRLAAGLAHELNNPAAAAASGAQRLRDALAELGEAAHDVGRASLSDEKRTRIRTVVTACERPGRMVLRDPVAQADQVDEISRWLQARALDVDLADTLVDGGVSLGTLSTLGDELSPGELRAAVRWIAAAASAAIVASDVERATRRINDIVTAMRGYTWMDKAPVRQPVDIARSLSDTVNVLSSEAHARGASIRLEPPRGLPPVSAVGPDLNQAWANLLQNALDAVAGGGEVVVSAATENGGVVVRVVDNGSGIPTDVQSRIFDPFFTTKPAGAGVGLGLDIVRRIARAHDGDVDFESRPGRTEFRVRLPATPA